MAVKLVITYEVVEAWHPEGEPEVDYVARSINEALPTFTQMLSDPTGSQAFKHYIGLLGVGDVVTEQMYFGNGQHYIIIGSSAEKSKNEYQKLKVTITTETGQKIKEITTNKVNDEDYFCVGFGVNADDPGIDGTISPNETPDITPGENKKPEPGWPIDPSIFTDMMNMMVNMMMMMAMMQMMVGMMGGMAQAFSTAW